MARKRYTVEQIIAKLREAEVELAKGAKTLIHICPSARLPCEKDERTGRCVTDEGLPIRIERGGTQIQISVL